MAGYWGVYGAPIIMPMNTPRKLGTHPHTMGT